MYNHSENGGKVYDKLSKDTWICVLLGPSSFNISYPPTQVFIIQIKILFAASMNLEECPLSKEELLKLVEEEAAMRVSASFLEQVGHQ